MTIAYPVKNTSQRTLLGLIIFINFIFIGQIVSPVFFSKGEFVPTKFEAAWQAISAGKSAPADWLELTTLYSAALLHGSVSHLLFNMLFLWVFAGLVGELLGVRWLLAIFSITAVVGYLGDAILRADSNIPALGASGAVMGFEGAYLGLAVRWSLPWPHIWPIAYAIPPLNLVILAVVGFGIDISGTINGYGGIAYGAHLGGFISGLFLTSFITPAPIPFRN